MTLEIFLKEYSEEKEFSKPLTLDDLDVCHLLVNDTTRVTFELDQEQKYFYLYTIIGIIPEDKTELVLKDAMQANLFGKETGFATLGFDPETRAMVLFERFSDQESTYETFKEHLGMFITLVERWIKRLEQNLEAKIPRPHTMDKELQTIMGKQKLQIFIA
jgi:hypothetical protein